MAKILAKCDFGDCNSSIIIEKVVFFDVIVEDDAGETEKPEEIIPYQLSKEATMMDMKVQDIMVSE